MEQLIVNNLTIKYLYGTEAISKLSFDTKKGEITTVLAQSEGGKTTLLKTLSGLTKVTEGEISLNGKNITKAKCKDRNVCLIYNEWGLNNNATVKKNLLYPLKVRKFDKLQAEEIVKNLIVKFNLVDIADKKVKKLTNNEKVAVVFARAFVREADLYLIDNIFNHIEENKRKVVFMEFLPIIKELSSKAPLVFATDSIFEAEIFGQNIIVLNYGIVLQKGDYQSILSSPMSLFVCKMFYGDKLSVLDAVIKEENNTIFIKLSEQEIILDKKKLINDIFIGKTVTVAYINDDKAFAIEKTDNKTFGVEINYNKAFGIKIFDKRSEQLIYFD